MKIKRLLTRARLGFVDSILDLAAWIDYLRSEERRNPYRCSVCGSTNIHTKAWIAPNRGSRFVEDIIDDGPKQDWCEECAKRTYARPTDIMLAEAEEWWGETDFRAMERITRYRQMDFDPEDGYQAFVDVCNKWWHAHTADEKISIHLENR